MTYREYYGEYTGTHLRTGVRYAWRMRVPAGDGPFGLIVTHDGLNEAHANAAFALAKTGEMPPCAVLGVSPGVTPPSLPGGAERNMRFNDYDMFDSRYADFLVDELIPALMEKFGLNISPLPDMHMICGGSSGGISAWNGVWFRNDYFRRAYLSSPTFSAMARGNIAPVQMRLFETKPIRVYIDWSEDEPDDYFGSSYCAAMEGRLALAFANYDYKWSYHPGEGHCSRWGNEEFAKEVLRFLWRAWDTEPIRPRGLSKRVSELIDANEPWRRTDEAFPPPAPCAVAGGVYEVRDGAVVFEKNGKQTAAAEGFPAPTAVALSSDGWRLYIADRTRACVYAASIQSDGSLTDLKPLCSLQTATDPQDPGAFGLCVSEDDWTLAATGLGVQCVRSFGLVDAILPLPGNAVPKQIRLSGNLLYADCGDAVFCRKMKIRGKQPGDKPSPPKHNGYYD
ncbi:MAG: hypothetical protein IJK23_13385 [Clostridia bacterium]|nr:hypothetical protein [Clostridia bacterium]